MPTQEDEKNIHDKLIELDKAFAAGKEVHRDAEHLLEEITQLGFSGGSEHFKRALSIYQMEARDGIADTDIQQPKRLLESGKYDYVGHIGSYFLQAVIAYDHLFLTRVYSGEFHARKGKIKISNRFNSEGRLDLIDAKLIRSLDAHMDGAIRHLVTIDGYRTLSKDWQTAPLLYLSCIPKEMIFVKGDILRASPPKLYNTLVGYAYRTASDLLDGISRETIAAETPRNPQQLPLDKIVHNDMAMYILGKAASLIPRCELLEGRLRLSYQLK